MEQMELHRRLAGFAMDHRFEGKGPLCVALVVTRHATKHGIPLDPDKLITAGGGQVMGLGKSAVQAILADHGIQRVLAAEGGRTSRGSLGRMRSYVEFLNELGSNIDLAELERYWIDRVRDFFAARPFRLRMDASKGLHAVVRDLIEQARARQREGDGVAYAGAMLQHLVGAALSCLNSEVEHHSHSTADQPKARPGDFVIGDVAIHVTTTPTEALIERCARNVEDAYRPVVVTLRSGVLLAYDMARRMVIEDRVDVLDIEPYMATKVYEMGGFSPESRRAALESIVRHYNEIIDQVETDPSLKIQMR